MQSQAAATEYNFAWRLNGDTQVAPLQVFDNGESIWLQFPQGQAVPAIFRYTPRGYLPVAFRHEGPYAVVAGNADKLMFRGGHLKAYAHRQNVEHLSDPEPSAQPDKATAYPLDPSGVPAPGYRRAEVTSPILDTPTHIAEKVSATQQLKASEPHAIAAHVIPGRDTKAPSLSRPKTEAAPESATHALPGAALHAQPLAVFDVGPNDQNLRVALQRWSKAAGWTFNAEQWAVAVDVPIAAKASFSADYVTSVQSLVSATELSDHPLQPCFYSNQVLRVVPYSQPCDRTAVPGDAQ
jgi:hypothetical protein